MIGGGGGGTIPDDLWAKLTSEFAAVRKPTTTTSRKRQEPEPVSAPPPPPLPYTSTARNKFKQFFLWRLFKTLQASNVVVVDDNMLLEGEDLMREAEADKEDFLTFWKTKRTPDTIQWVRSLFAETGNCPALQFHEQYIREHYRLSSNRFVVVDNKMCYNAVTRSPIDGSGINMTTLTCIPLPFPGKKTNTPTAILPDAAKIHLTVDQATVLRVAHVVYFFGAYVTAVTYELADKYRQQLTGKTVSQIWAGDVPEIFKDERYESLRRIAEELEF